MVFDRIKHTIYRFEDLGRSNGSINLLITHYLLLITHYLKAFDKQHTPLTCDQCPLPSFDTMFSDKFIFSDKSPIVTIQLHPSDYELTLKRLLIYYGDRHSDNSVFYWNNGYNNLVKLSLEKQKLRYSPIPDDRPYNNPLSLISVQKLPGLYIFDNLLDFTLLSTAEKSVRESQIYNCANHLSHQSGVQVVLLGEWIQLSPKLRVEPHKGTKSFIGSRSSSK